MFEITSEIYSETDFQSIESSNGKVLSKFHFVCPDDEEHPTTDSDGDLILPRKKVQTLEIEHYASSNLNLVGLQVWRGSLLLADFIFHNRHKFGDKQIMELGAGVGLGSIAAAIYCKTVISTDINVGGILDLIRGNIERNNKLIRNTVQVMELDFTVSDYPIQLRNVIENSDVIIAADVIYDDDLSECFVRVLDLIFSMQSVKSKEVFIALEKRYVFTLEDLETVAPCFEHFMKLVSLKPWLIEYIPTDFPQYFEYKRCKNLTLFKISKL